MCVVKAPLCFFASTVTKKLLWATLWVLMEMYACVSAAYQLSQVYSV